MTALTKYPRVGAPLRTGLYQKSRATGFGPPTSQRGSGAAFLRVSILGSVRAPLTPRNGDSPAEAPGSRPNQKARSQPAQPQTDRGAGGWASPLEAQSSGEDPAQQTGPPGPGLPSGVIATQEGASLQHLCPGPLQTGLVTPWTWSQGLPG